MPTALRRSAPISPAGVGRRASVAVVIGLVAALAACDDTASTSAPTVTTTASATATAGSIVRRFGEPIQDGDVTIVVTAPVTVTAGKDAASGCRLRSRVVYRVAFRITNTSRQPWSTDLATAGTSGQELACAVNERDDQVNRPEVVLPSRTATIYQEFGVEDASKPFTVLVDGRPQLFWTNDPAALKAAGR